MGTKLETGNGGSLLSGPDARTLSDFKIAPRTSGIVEVTLPDINGRMQTLYPNEQVQFGGHSSSRGIQLGLNVKKQVGDKIQEAFINNGHTTNVTMRVEVENLSYAPLMLPENAALFTLYAWNGQLLKDNELKETINKKDGVQIHGKRGKDWWWHRDEEGNILGIDVALNQHPDMMRWLPPDSPEVTIPTEKHFNFRQYVDNTLTAFSDQQPAPDDEVLWIAETDVRITLPKDIHALIITDPDFLNENQSSRMLANQGQANSPLLTGGRTDWPVRVEIMSKTNDEERPDTIFIAFAKAAKWRHTKKPNR